MIPKLGRFEKYGYGFGALGEGMAFNLVNSFFMVYCTDVLGIAAGFMAGLFFFARLWDAVNDPIMGTYSENKRTKWGKHKPWVVLGGISNAAVVVLMFAPFLGRLSSPLFAVTALYLLCDITYTIIDVPYYAYAASFTDLKERDHISVIPRIFGGVATIGIPALTLPMVGKLGGGSSTQGYFRWALIVAAIFILCSLVAAAAMKKREIGHREEKFTLRDTLRTLKDNDQLLVIETVFVLAMTAITMTTSVALYYFKYVWHDPGAYSLFTLTAGAGMGAGLLSYSLLVKKFSRRAIFITSLTLSITGYLLMFAISMLTKNVNFLLPAVVIMVAGFGYIGIFTSVFMVDVVEYGEWKQGYRSENILFSLVTFMGKFSGAFASLITMGVLALAGYVSTKEDLMGDATVITAQPESVNFALHILMFAVPPLILLTALWLYLKKYKLHGAYMQKITDELAAKRES